MSNEEILELIANISPHAMEYVKQSFINNEVDILYAISTQQNKGIFIKVENEDCCIFYAYFLNEDEVEDILNQIICITNEYLSKTVSKEVCFNVYGNNLKIIKLVRDIGFKSDMEGYHLEYIGKLLPELHEMKLNHKGFDNNRLEAYVELFDQSYYQVCTDNGWNPNYYSINKEEFKHRLNQLNKCDQVHSFWLNNEIIGAYIFEGNYITDMVVKPNHQNKGYGSYMLSHCIKNMMSKSINNIRLRVARSNVGAKKLYERYNFFEIACFAEHTY